MIKNMTIEKWKEISRELVFNKWRKVEKVVFEMQNGNIGDFYLKKDGPVSATLAFTKDKKVILAKQFRPGLNEILSELPGGLVEKNSNSLKTAERELLEETGYKGKMEFVSSYYVDGYSDRLGNIFVALDCEKVADQKLDEGEFIETELLSLEEFRKLLRSGKMTDVQGGYLGLDYLGLL